jgi:hypothetical protein
VLASGCAPQLAGGCVTLRAGDASHPPHPQKRTRRDSTSRASLHSLFSVLCSLFSVLCSLFSVLCSLFPVLCSLFPVPDAVRPIPHAPRSGRVAHKGLEDTTAAVPAPRRSPRMVPPTNQSPFLPAQALDPCPCPCPCPCPPPSARPISRCARMMRLNRPLVYADNLQ